MNLFTVKKGAVVYSMLDMKLKDKTDTECQTTKERTHDKGVSVWKSHIFQNKHILLYISSSGNGTHPTRAHRLESDSSLGHLMHSC